MGRTCRLMDREKVIKGLEHCSDPDMCNADCPYYKDYDDVYDCMSKLSGDVLELLKEQEPEEPIRMHHTEHKQTDNYRCRKCGNDLYFEQRFCEACGTEVNWNE